MKSTYVKNGSRVSFQIARGHAFSGIVVRKYYPKGQSKMIFEVDCGGVIWEIGEDFIILE